MIYSLFKELKTFFLKKEKGVFFFLVLAFIGLWFLIEPVDSLKFLLRIFAILLFLTGFMDHREFSYDPHLRAYNQQKKMRSIIFMLAGVIIALAPFFFVEWTGTLLGLFFIFFSVQKLLEMRKNYFDFISMLQVATGQYYALILLLGLLLFFNSLFLKLVISYILGGGALLIAIRGLIEHFSKYQK